MTDQAILAVTENIPDLEWLDFSYCLQITDNAVEAIAARCSKLTTLKMVGLYRITDKSMHQFASPGHNLRYLDITECTKIKQEMQVGRLLQTSSQRRDMLNTFVWSQDAFRLSTRGRVTIGNNAPLFPNLIAQLPG